MCRSSLYIRALLAWSSVRCAGLWPCARIPYANARLRGHPDASSAHGGWFFRRSQGGGVACRCMCRSFYIYVLCLLGRLSDVQAFVPAHGFPYSQRSAPRPSRRKLRTRRVVFSSFPRWWRSMSMYVPVFFIYTRSACLVVCPMCRPLALRTDSIRQRSAPRPSDASSAHGGWFFRRSQGGGVACRCMCRSFLYIRALLVWSSVRCAGLRPCARISIQPTLGSEAIPMQAPHTEGGFFVVPKVVA